MSFEELKEVFVDTLNCDADKVTMEASLTEDLQADSLDAVELNMAFEDKFGITIADEDLGTLKTVGDIFNYLVARAAYRVLGMNAIEKLFPVSQQERSFQLKVRRDAGTAAPGWVQPQFVECKKCGRRATRQVWTKSLYVCPNCGVHLPIGAYYRLSTILDHGTFKELNPDLAPNDVLHFPDYQEKLAAASVKTGLKEAAVTATGRIGGVQAVAAVLDSRFFMGSMSTAVGEKITRAIEYAADKRLPLVIFSASGGARMQEGIFSLMQMAKTSAALERFSRSGGLYVSVLTHPTTGGVTASFASLGDITLAEPGALIGFAGPRVIEQTIGEKLPDGFQRSEFQLEHGFVDQVVPRTELKEVLTRILQLHTQGRKCR